MRPSEIRRCVLDDHRMIREMLNSIEVLAWHVLRGEDWPEGSLRFESQALLDRLREHMQFEDVHLKPALMKSGVFGAARARKLDQDHRFQRRLLRRYLAALATVVVTTAGRPSLPRACGFRQLGSQGLPLG